MKHNRVFLFVVVYICVCMICGCNPADDDSSTGVADLTAVKWRLQYFSLASDNESVIDSTRITALFEEKRDLGGSSGCNTYFADYAAADDGTISVSDIGVTKMYCESPDGIMAQETKYLNALRDVKRFEIQANTMKLFYGDSDEYLYFKHPECITNDDCLTGLFCEKNVDDCEGLGTCAVIPDACDLNYQPVCGCDGNTYSNACDAASSSVNVLREGTCDAVLCTDLECGPALGMPNYTCSDGTIGGPTGRCVLNTSGSCGWEIRDCT
jgi:heat shock protein HslJ